MFGFYFMLKRCHFIKKVLNTAMYTVQRLYSFELKFSLHSPLAHVLAYFAWPVQAFIIKSLHKLLLTFYNNNVTLYKFAERWINSYQTEFFLIVITNFLELLCLCKRLSKYLERTIYVVVQTHAKVFKSKTIQEFG